MIENRRQTRVDSVAGSGVMFVATAETPLLKNKKSSGFLPEERLWLDKFYGTGWIDTFRKLNPDPHWYTWWSQRFPTVRAQNKGWRIDYINVTESLAPRVKAAAIYPDVKQSDHCPVFLELA